MDKITYNGHSYYGIDLKSVSTTRTQSLPIAALQADTLRCTVASDSDISNFQQNAPLLYSDGQRQIMRCFVQDIRRIAPNLYEIEAASTVALLTQIGHRGGVYDNALASAVIADICDSVVSYYIAPEFSSVPINGWLPNVAPDGAGGAAKGSARDNLMRVLFALGANLRVAEDGTLRIENLPSEAGTTIPVGRVHMENAAVNTEKPTSALVLVVHRYMADSNESNRRVLFEGTATAGQVVTFAEPVQPSTLELNGSTFTGTCGANYAILPAGSGMLTGIPYIHGQRETAPEPVSTTTVENIVRISDQTLVSEANASDILARLKAYYLCRKTITAEVVPQSEKPGDVVSLYNPYTGIQQDACIESSTSAASAVGRASIVARVGFYPHHVVPKTDEHEIVTASQTYTMPSTLLPNTEVTIILIGGGSGGTNGGNGTNGGGGYKQISVPRYTAASGSIDAGSAGTGGAAGTPGIGGKIWQGAITCNAGDSLIITIGSGGASGGGAGGNTTLKKGSTTYSSANGSGGGYYDSSLHLTLGLDGAEGVAGANGGKGGSGSGGGTAGGNAGTHTGGSGGNGAGASTSFDSYTAGGGGGGGASNAANGSNGGNGGINQARDTFYSTGGNGAAAVNKSTAAHYGDGGDAGDGGGGGGGAGAVSYSIPAYDHGAAGTITLSGTGGTGGSGGTGGAGKSGCCILIYRVPIA